MATLFGRFEIQSEISKSETALIYKATDTQTQQVVALKTQSLQPLGDRADAFVDALIAEGESTRDLVSQNIVLLYGAGEIDGQFCAAMEYIQGNSVATMLARKEGFSIWDLLDITRQVCAGLEHAAAKGVIHCSLEPAKIMVQWDGMVKILGYGISNMSLIEAESGKNLGRLMPYCSPEQIRGETVDLRSNLFTLGAMLYEMVAGQRAFDAEDPVALVNQILNETPANPSSVNSKIQPGVSALILKALAKDPADRYQSARALLDDLEECKEGGKKTAADFKPATPAPGVAANPAALAAAAGKFATAPSRAPKPAPSIAPTVSTPPASVSAASTPNAAIARTSVPAGANSIAAAAGAGASGASDAHAGYKAGSNFHSNFSSNSGSNSNSKPNSQSDSKSDATSGARLEELDTTSPESQAARGPVLSAAVARPESERRSPSVAVDPMMAGPAPGSSGKSFSDLAEMPPLKEPVFEAPAPEPVEAVLPVAQIYPRKEEKPRIQPREVAGNALHQIATVPPRLMLFSILGAVGLILAIVIAVFFHVRSEDDDSTVAPKPVTVSSATPTSAQPVAQIPVAPPVEKAAPPIVEEQPALKVRQVKKGNPASPRRVSAPAPVPVAIPGQALIDSNPQGAQFQIDGKSDPSWVTPFDLMGLSSGKHIISVSKAGYSSEVRSVDVVAGGKASLVLHLSPVNALMVVNSTPAGADVIIDGKPTGRVTPVQFAVEKGSHTVLLRKQGYLDETATADLGPAQNFQYSPNLRALGNVSDMKTVGKFNKLFGHGGDSTAGMGSVSVRTQPRGAQVAINRQILDKLSPVDVMLGPGNYTVDITLTGFNSVHKIVSVDKGGKVAINEILERQ